MLLDHFPDLENWQIDNCRIATDTLIAIIEAQRQIYFCTK